MKALPYFREPHACACGDHGFVGLTRGRVTLISPTDVELVRGHWWHFSAGGGYARTSVRGRNLTMHRLIMPTDQPHIDHRNGEQLDNRRSNLRPCTVAENIRNSGAKKNLSSRFKGVYVAPGAFCACIRENGAMRSLGSFATEEAAARAYDAAARRAFGEFARTNEDEGLYDGTKPRLRPLSSAQSFALALLAQGEDPFGQTRMTTIRQLQKMALIDGLTVTPAALPYLNQMAAGETQAPDAVVIGVVANIYRARTGRECPAISFMLQLAGVK